MLRCVPHWRAPHLKTPSKEAYGESAEGAVSDMAEEMQDNAYSEEPMQPSEEAAEG
jgi:hypothetical protein